MRLLIIEPSCRRLEATITTQGPGVAPLLVDDAGPLTHRRVAERWGI
ncbi:MAG: hypothetical protein JWP35_1120 [Caulobacter sp.]|nr:hypothetical protein [Caulobacter sp.]